MSNPPTAAIVIIGNEILSGRTKDANTPWLGERLAEAGVVLTECRIIRDDEQAIIEAVNALRVRNDYVFTTGGIGPTHDDITAAAIARAFDTELHRHPEALAALLGYYTPEKANEARLKMADVPKGAILVDNPVSVAPGFRMENVYVFAGVPRIMQAMFDGIRHELRRGEPIESRSVTVFLTEGAIAQGLSEIQERYSYIEIGSYPMIRDERLGTSLVMRGSDVQALEQCRAEVLALVRGLGADEIVE